MAETVKKYTKGKLYQMSLTELSPDPDQPRKYFDPQALAELTDSVLKHGVLHPVLARRAPDGKLVVVSGERRYQAALKAGLASVPVIITDGEALEVSIVENLLRENLTAVEEAEAIDRLRSRNNYSLADLAGMLGKSQAAISEILSINKLPDTIKNECRNEPRTPKYLLVEIAKQPDRDKMKQVYDKYKNTGMTIGELKSTERTKSDQNQKDAAAFNITFIPAFVKKLDGVDLAKLDQTQATQLAIELGKAQSTISTVIGNILPQ